MLDYSISIVECRPKDKVKTDFKIVVTPGKHCLTTIKFTKHLIKNSQIAFNEFDDLQMDISTSLRENTWYRSSKIEAISWNINNHTALFPKFTNYITFRKNLISWIKRAQEWCRLLAKFSVTGKFVFDSGVKRKSKIVLEEKLSNRVKVFEKCLMRIEKLCPPILYKRTMTVDGNVIPNHIFMFIDHITKDFRQSMRYSKPYISTTNESLLFALLDKNFG